MEDKQERYGLLYRQIQKMIVGEDNETSVLANVSAALHDEFPDRFYWVGFYLALNGELRLGPFQGSVACFRIGYGRGVCGDAWAEHRTIVVPDVEKYSGHIACSPLSRSEIVVPLFDKNNVLRAVLDIDSTQLNAFDEADRAGLEAIAQLIAGHIYGR